MVAVEPVARRCHPYIMLPDSLSTWLGFLSSPAAPRTAMSPMELDGYLTGIVLAPDPLPRDLWLDQVFGVDDPDFDSTNHATNILGAVMDHYDDLYRIIDAAFEKLEAGEPTGYQPLFSRSGDKPHHDAVRAWVSGFAKAIELAPDAWLALAGDERTQVLLAPFVAFSGVVDDPALGAVEDIDACRDEAALAIPRVVIALGKLAQLSRRAHNKTGRNAPCPCGSGKKYKRCCGDS